MGNRLEPAQGCENAADDEVAPASWQHRRGPGLPARGQPVHLQPHRRLAPARVGRDRPPHQEPPAAEHEDT
eukprot:1825603-Lingulodinium_polyedra.AAC.1